MYFQKKTPSNKKTSKQKPKNKQKKPPKNPKQILKNPKQNINKKPQTQLHKKQGLFTGEQLTIYSVYSAFIFQCRHKRMDAHWKMVEVTLVGKKKPYGKYSRCFH